MKKCEFCGSNKTCYSVTELQNGKITKVFNMCADCGKNYFKEVEKDLKQNHVDLTNITTPEELLNFIKTTTGKLDLKKPCPKCGWTIKQFNVERKLGCPICYDHFEEELKNIAVSYHGAKEHMGKRPHLKSKLLSKDPIEKEKIIKLRMAQAVELENYELAAKYRDELKGLSS